MLYFAELSGKRVVSADGSTIGRLTDFAFLATDQPLVTKLRVDTKVGHILVPVSSVAAIKDVVTLTSGYETVGISENELSVRIHLLDQQIIDIKGNKVVRVNDVVIQDKPYLVIAGVDVGILGIARWLKLEQWLNRQISRFGTSLRSDFLPWENIQPLELSRGKVKLKREEAKLTKLAPEDLADHLERLSV
ncbi:MAG TPA: PRC-barrel domain-containing protein, partial [Patescibacteria group bacterium]|nr:PRC-barrel domain-containing protein [Patescibacteria group bacterium]